MAGKNFGGGGDKFTWKSCKCTPGRAKVDFLRKLGDLDGGSGRVVNLVVLCLRRLKSCRLFFFWGGGRKVQPPEKILATPMSRYNLRKGTEWRNGTDRSIAAFCSLYSVSCDRCNYCIQLINVQNVFYIQINEYTAQCIDVQTRADNGSHFVTRDTCDPSVRWPVTRMTYDLWPSARPWHESITTTYESGWVHDYYLLFSAIRNYYNIMGDWVLLSK